MFRKKVDIAVQQRSITYKDSLITFGSCFSDSIGTKLEKAALDIWVNPLGVIFHPLALADAINGIHSDKIIERDHYYFHWQLGGNWHSDSEELFREQIRELQTNIKTALDEATVVMVTFGTAWGYELKASAAVVTNCHKMPQNLFEKKLFSPADILGEWSQIVRKYDHIQWVFTISPVRHWKDGVRENNVSKGILHQVIHELIKEDNATYFPAYEILLDELRDYRFYKSDYLHPDEEAIDYIWTRFKESFLAESANALVEKVEKLKTSQNHQLLFPESEESKRFLMNLEKQKSEISLLLAAAKD